MDDRSITTTRDDRYTNRLVTRESAWWKRMLNVQAPYRWNLRRLKPGFTLEIGCGIGRNLGHLDGNCVGVDHNAHSIEVSRSRGFRAYTPDDFKNSEYSSPESFDCLLLAHILEHMTAPEARELVAEYLPRIRKGGQVIMITPQEAGYKSDASHVQFADFTQLESIASAIDLKDQRFFSFPFPRFCGKVFKYNEFVLVGRR